MRSDSAAGHRLAGPREHDHQLVLDHIDEYGELSARRLSRFVHQVLRLAGTRNLVLGHTTWGCQA
ncbi:hypothetical protein [Streptomyces sp. NPDC053079]|uniref:hypothetical protein n=1 Tax=Streptomyces sp. NPDC053079 TaxID=3365697 RepID=UPI0037D9686A